MGLVYKEYTLNEAAVDMVSADVQDYLNKLNMENRNILRIRLTVEELLLNVQEHCGKGIKISVGLGKKFGSHIFRLQYHAQPFDPSKPGANPLADDMMRLLGLFPAWSCRGNTNTVSLVLESRLKRGMTFYILLAAAAAVVLGLFGNIIPENVQGAISDSVLSSVSNGFLGLLNTFGGMMIFFTLCSGISQMDDIATFGRTGRSVVFRFVGIAFGIGALTVVAVLPFVSLNFSTVGQEQVSEFDQISRMFFDILPTNIIDPFGKGNILQIIVIALFAGCALLAVGELGSRVRGLIVDLSALFQRIVSFVCALVPLFVFSTLLKLIWSGQAGVLISLLKPIILTVVLTIILTVTVLIIASFYLKCSPMLLIKKIFPVFIVAFTTASSVSAFQIGMETCEKKLGIKQSFTSFAYPLGSVIYMPASVVYFTVLVGTFAGTYQIAVGIPWLIMAVVSATLMTIAMPPIPEGDILCYTVLFSSLGIPAEAIIMATTIGIMVDYICTGINVALLIVQITCDAKRLNFLDRETLLA